MTSKTDKATHTKERILDMAEALFAKKGFHGVSVREITAAAGCNMAGINYHFGGKKNLYTEVFRARWIPRELQMYESFKNTVENNKTISTGEIIQALARAYIDCPLSKEELRLHRQLIIREINDPTDVFKLAADHTLRPLFEYLYHVLKKQVLENKTEEDLTFDIMSIFGVILYFNYSRPMVSRITGKAYDSDFKTWLITHMERFILNGLDINYKTKQ